MYFSEGRRLHSMVNWTVLSGKEVVHLISNNREWQQMWETLREIDPVATGPLGLV